jgi:hypothetical protein
MVKMGRDEAYGCPRCDYALGPVHAVEGSRRRIIALTCPEPYCDHMQMVTQAEARRIDEKRLRELQPAPQARAN